METKQLISWLRDKADRAHDQSWTRMMHKAADKLKELDQQWIPVTERLPEKAGEYLVFSKAGNYNIQYFYIDGSYKAFIYVEVGTITHWMPLPEPPKEVDHEP